MRGWGGAEGGGAAWEWEPFCKDVQQQDRARAAAAQKEKHGTCTGCRPAARTADARGCTCDCVPEDRLGRAGLSQRCRTSTAKCSSAQALPPPPPCLPTGVCRVRSRLPTGQARGRPGRRPAGALTALAVLLAARVGSAACRPLQVRIDPRFTHTHTHMHTRSQFRSQFPQALLRLRGTH